MYQKFIKPLGLMLIVAAGFFMSSCQKEETAADVENFVLQSTYEIEERCAAGSAGCYELVFPVTLQFSDSTTQEVASYDEMKQAIRTWFEANGGRPRPQDRPRLVFPYDVINEDGEVITVTNQEEVRVLREACVRGNFGPGGHHGHFGKDHACFRPVFPFTLEFPDSSQVTVNTPREFVQAIREWRQNNPGSTERPGFVFPLTVQLHDRTEVIVNSAEELAALKEACRG